MDAGGARGRGTPQNTPSLPAMGPVAEHRQPPLQSPFIVPVPRGSLEQCPALPWLQEQSREPSEVPHLGWGHSSGTGKASSHPSPCVLETARPGSAQGIRASSTTTRTPRTAKPPVHAPNLHLRRCRVLGAGVNCPGGRNQCQNGSAVKNQQADIAQQHQGTPLTRLALAVASFLYFSDTQPQVSEINKEKG